MLIRSSHQCCIVLTLSVAIVACGVPGPVQERTWREICDRPVPPSDPAHPLFGKAKLIEYDRAAIHPEGSARDSDLITRVRVAEVCTPRTTAPDGELPDAANELSHPYLYRPIRLEIVELLTDPGQSIDGLIVFDPVGEYRGFTVWGLFVQGFELNSEGIIFAELPSEFNRTSTHVISISDAAKSLTVDGTHYEAALPINWYAIDGTRAVSRVSEEDSDVSLDRLLEIVEEWGPAPAP